MGLNCPYCGSDKNIVVCDNEYVMLECNDCKTQWTVKNYAGSKIIKIPIPKLKQNGWELINHNQNNYLVYIRRKCNSKLY